MCAKPAYSWSQGETIVGGVCLCIVCTFISMYTPTRLGLRLVKYVVPIFVSLAYASYCVHFTDKVENGLG